MMEGVSETPVLSPDLRYTRMEFMNSGSYKSVYRALDNVEGVEVAWCEVPCTHSLEEQAQQEIFLLGHLHHPNVLRCYNSWHDTGRGRFVFITELMITGTLADYTRRLPGGCLRPTAVVRYARQILHALRYLHARHLTHRDLNPRNLFLNAHRGEVKVGDFGLAMMRRNASAAVGTPGYMAPEMSAPPYGRSVDIWSFGLCVLEMAVGPFPSGDVEAAMERVPDASLRRLVRCCLRPDASRRLTAAELLNDAVFVPQSGDGGRRAGDGSAFASVEAWLRCAPEEVQADALQCAWRRGWTDAPLKTMDCSNAESGGVTSAERTLAHSQNTNNTLSADNSQTANSSPFANKSQTATNNQFANNWYSRGSGFDNGRRVSASYKYLPVEDEPLDDSKGLSLFSTVPVYIARTSRRGTYNPQQEEYEWINQ